MKKHIYIFLLLLSFSVSAQVVTTNPSFVTAQSGVILVIFDASQGNAGLKDYTGPIYAHTGVITSASTGSSDWKHVITDWPTATNQSLVNLPKNQLSSLGNNKWQLTITPDIYSYYGITDAAEVVKQMAFVFRNADGSRTGKTSTNGDIFVNVYQSGLNVELTAPADNSVITKGSSVSITASAAPTCDMKLYLNTTLLTSGTAVSSLSTSYTFTNAGNYQIIAEASLNGTTQRDTAFICVPKDQVVASRPLNLEDGVTVNGDGSVTFCLAIPSTARSSVFLLGDFNDFHPNNDYMMNLQTESAAANKYGRTTNYYWLTLNGLDPAKEYAFQYLVDGNIRIGDPYCEKILDPWNDKYINSTYNIYPDLRSYPSTKAQDVLSTFRINHSSYQWQATSFTPPAQNKLMIYELLLRDFTPEGSVKAAIAKLDYLKALGINAIELMPIQEFDGNDSWGYNPNFYFAPDKAYGTKADYQLFVDECHKRGIAVILDIVFNHTYGLSPMCKLWWDGTNSRPSTTNPYYNAVAPHPYSVGNDIRHDQAFVRGWLKRALQFWLSEYKVDGFRFDLSKGLTQTVSTESTAGNYDAARISYIKEYVDAIKEVNPNAYAILEHFCNTDEEDALAAYKNTMLWRNMNWAYQQAAKGLNTGDFTSMVGTNRIGYPESHDEERLAYALFTGGQSAVRDTANAMKQLAACAAFAYLNPGPRMMWQFGELGYDYSINYNGRTGRKPIRWDYLNNPLRKGLHDTYAKVLNFRNNYSDLFANPTTWNWQVTTSDWANGRRIYLSNGSLKAVVIANFTTTGAVTAYPAFGQTGNWYELISGETLNVTDPNMSLSLPAFDLKIYTNSLISGVTATKTEYAEIYPNPVADNLQIKGKQAAEIELFSASGIKVLHNKVENQSVNISVLPAGIYMGRISFDDGTVAQCKVCKK